MKREKEQIKNIQAYSIIIVIGLIFYLIPGKWISIEKDTATYLSFPNGREGVLPGYPAFLFFFKMVFGEQYFLHYVVVAQSLLAVLCTFFFILILKKQFELKRIECILLYILCMLPFSIYLPDVGITHQIMTEGITYAVFYLFFIMVIKAVWTLEYKWYLGSLVMAFILGLVRSQMLFLQVVCLVLLVWIVVRKNRNKGMHKIVVGTLAFLFGLVLAFASYKAIYAVVAFDISTQSDKAKVTEVKVPENKGKRSETAQFDSVIIARGFYEADENDVNLFDDEMMQKIFKRTYQLADEGRHLHIYASSDLYMWRKLVYDGMKGYAFKAIKEYDMEYPGERMRSPNSIVRELGLRVLLKHFDRYIYHTIRLMMPSFIATVFFQIEPIYLLCHFVALFLYISAIVASIFVYKRNGNRRAVELVATIICIMVIMVVLVNIMYMGLQRYVVYGMGIFYCAMYMLLREIIFCLKRRVEDKCQIIHQTINEKEENA